MPSIYRRGSRWWVSYRDEKTGKRVQKSAGDTREEAVEFLAARDQVQDEKLPLRSVLEAYCRGQIARSKFSSIQQAEVASGHLIRILGNLDVHELSAADVDRFILLRRREVADRTVNSNLTYLRAALNYAVASGVLEKLPVRIKLLRVAKKRSLRLLADTDFQKLLKNAQEPYYGLILVLSTTGFRISEAVNLTWRDVYWDQGKLAVTAKKNWSPKSYQEREVYVPTSVINYLKSRFEQSSTPYVFADNRGRVLRKQAACVNLRKLFERCGLYSKGTPLSHWIRHTVCSRMLGAGMDIETVRTIMGHADASTTMLYAHTDSERLKKSTEVLGGLISTD